MERHGSPRDAAGTEPRALIGATATDARILAVPAQTRREAVGKAESSAPVVPVAPDPVPSLVRVVGNVRRAGRPLAGFDLSFLVLEWGRDLEECDWSFTDDVGRYEVELPAARYVVRDEAGAEVAEVVVPGGGDEFALDLDLGPARWPDRK